MRGRLELIASLRKSSHMVLMAEVADVCSGIIDGPMQQKSVAARGGKMDWKCQIKSRGTPQEVANLIAWLLCDDTKYISGSVQVIDGGWLC